MFCVANIFYVNQQNNDINIIMWELKSLFNVVALLIMVVISFVSCDAWYACSIEDYISCHKLRNTLIIIVQLFCIVTIVAFVVAMFYKG